MRMRSWTHFSSFRTVELIFLKVDLNYAISLPEGSSFFPSPLTSVGIFMFLFLNKDRFPTISVIPLDCFHTSLRNCDVDKFQTAAEAFQQTLAQNALAALCRLSVSIGLTLDFLSPTHCRSAPIYEYDLFLWMSLSRLVSLLNVHCRARMNCEFLIKETCSHIMSLLTYS